MEDWSIRESGPADLAAIEALYPDAFPEEDLLPLVRELLDDRVRVLSLVAIGDAGLIGHIAFTECRLPDPRRRPALLGPLAVATNAQRRGVGSALVRAGLKRLTAAGVDHVLVLGDPRYYERFGFEPEALVEPPYRLPDDWSGAWRSMRLDASAPTPRGTLLTPPVWSDRALWAP